MAGVVPTVQLHTGAAMPRMAFGTGTTWFEGAASSDASPLAGETSNSTPLHRCLTVALDAGLRHIDCAEMYGTEHMVGGALAAWMARTGTDRAGVFVTSKVWRGMQDVGAACRASLERLQLDHLDLYLIHTPVSFMSWVAKGDRVGVQRQLWGEMEALVEAGLTKAIGVSNFSEEELLELLAHAKIKPAVNQVEHHPFCQAGTGRDNSALRTLCSEHGIILEAYSPLAPLKDTQRTSGAALASLVGSLATSKAVEPATVLLRWSLDHGAAVVTTSTRPERIAGMASCFDDVAALTAEERAALDAAGMAKRERGYWADEFEDGFSDGT
jgi:diketogulonate reductase-like aldo/keto reductase